MDRLGEGLSAADLARVEAALAARPDLAPALHAAANCPSYGLPSSIDAATLEDDAIDRIVRLRKARWLLRLETRLRLAQGRRQQAFAGAMDLLRLSRHAAHEPGMVGYINALQARGHALASLDRVLRDGPLPSESYDALDVQLAGLEGPSEFRRALATERAVGLASLDATLGFRPFLGWDRRDYLRMMEQQVAEAATPYYALRSPSLQEGTYPPGSYSTVVELALPAISLGREIETNSFARVRCLRIVAAIVRRSPEGAPFAPIDLDDLGLPAEALVDPFSGGRLLVRWGEAGPAVYSVGRDREDDGFVDDYEDVGLAPRPPDARLGGP